MTRHVFYCRCGARLEGSSAHLFHRCPDQPATGGLTRADLIEHARARARAGQGPRPFVDYLAEQIVRLGSEDISAGQPVEATFARARASLEAVALCVSEVWHVRCAVQQAEAGPTLKGFTLQLLDDAEDDHAHG